MEEEISCLAVYFQYLAQVLDANGKRCLKTDHFAKTTVIG